jgi:uncharacterized RDD family membrane protein YckC
MSIREHVQHPNFGGFGSRLIASFLDFFIISIFIFGISKLLGLTTDESMSLIYGQNVAPDLSIVETLFYILTIAYYIILPATSLRATIGKLMMGLQIVNEVGNRISLLRSTGRYLASFVSAVILFAGFIMIIFHPEKRGLHDIIANTYVLKKNTR